MNVKAGTLVDTLSQTLGQLQAETLGNLMSDLEAGAPVDTVFDTIA